MDLPTKIERIDLPDVAYLRKTYSDHVDLYWLSVYAGGQQRGPITQEVWDEAEILFGSREVGELSDVAS